MKKTLKYKGIEFDHFIDDDYGVESSICKECQNKYNNRLSKDYEIQGSGAGVCGVKGCTNSDWEIDIEVNYIDFDINGVEVQ